MAPTPTDLLTSWLRQRVSDELRSWLDQALADLPGKDFRQLQFSLALIARKLGKGTLDLDATDLAAADAARTGWNPATWSREDAGRVLGLLVYAPGDADFGETFQRLCQQADLSELVSFYRGLPLYPLDAKIDWQIGEGLRTSIQAVFEAIAHDSPLPAEHFDEHRWNHMVLKVLFIGSTLEPVMGLDSRRNAKLAATLSDHVHERWAAGRQVELQVWRCLAPFAGDGSLDDLQRLIGSDDLAERRAAALCLLESPHPRAAQMQTELAAEIAQARSGALTWNRLAA